MDESALANFCQRFSTEFGQTENLARKPLSASRNSDYE
jgi:hypothetical protein